VFMWQDVTSRLPQGCDLDGFAGLSMP